MHNVSGIIAALTLVTLAGCAGMEPSALPNVNGEIVRPMNEGKWNYQQAVAARQSRLDRGVFQ